MPPRRCREARTASVHPVNLVNPVQIPLTIHWTSRIEGSQGRHENARRLRMLQGKLLKAQEKVSGTESDSFSFPGDLVPDTFFSLSAWTSHSRPRPRMPTPSRVEGEAHNLLSNNSAQPDGR